MIRVLFRGGPYAGVRRVEKTPELLILTMGDAHHIYQRVIDPDTGEFTDVYEFHSTKYGTDEALSLEGSSDDDCCPCGICIETIGYDPEIPCPHCPKHPNGRTP